MIIFTRNWSWVINLWLIWILNFKDVKETLQLLYALNITSISDLCECHLTVQVKDKQFILKAQLNVGFSFSFFFFLFFFYREYRLWLHLLKLKEMRLALKSIIWNIALLEMVFSGVYSKENTSLGVLSFCCYYPRDKRRWQLQVILHCHLHHRTQIYSTHIRLLTT